jgi:hypothetical protein
VPAALEAAIRRMAAEQAAKTADRPAPVPTLAPAAAPTSAAEAAPGPPGAPVASGPAPAGEPARARARFGVIEGGAAEAMSARAGKRWPFDVSLPLAAALVFALGGAFGASVTRYEPPVVASVLAHPEGAAALARALAAVPSGEMARFATRRGVNGEITLVASYRLPDGRLCREFETRFTGMVRGREIGAACRGAAGGAFAPVIAVSEPPSADGSYAPASGAATAVEEHLQGLGVSGALDQAAERAVLAR